MRRFAAWLTEEGEIPADPFLGVKSPKLDERVVEPLTDDELRALLKACVPPKGATPAEALRHRRDEAIVRVMLETGTRAGEVVALELGDVDLINGALTVRRGKGGKGRVVPIGPEASLALDRYLRLRRAHRLAASPDLWLGDRGKRFSYDALHKTLRDRADTAGLVGFHPHKLRHTAAHRWLAAGGSESGLMAVAGWTRPDMLMRYTKAQASAQSRRGGPQTQPGGAVTETARWMDLLPGHKTRLVQLRCVKCQQGTIGAIFRRTTAGGQTWLSVGEELRTQTEIERPARLDSFARVDPSDL